MPKKKSHLEPDPYLEPTPTHAHHVLAMLADSFGSKKAAIEFMRAHAGCAILIPKQSVVERLAMELSAAESLEKDPSVNNAIRLASLHNVPRRILSRSYQVHNGQGIMARRNQQHCRHPRLSRLKVRLDCNGRVQDVGAGAMPSQRLKCCDKVRVVV